MDEFNADSAVDNPKDRINYLEDEKNKSSKGERSDLSQPSKADSLIRGKF